MRRLSRLAVPVAVALVPGSALALGTQICRGPHDLTIDWQKQVVVLDGKSHGMQLEKLGKHAGVYLFGDGITVNHVKNQDARSSTVVTIGGVTQTYHCKNADGSGKHKRDS